MKNIRLFNVALLLVCVLCVTGSRAQDHTRLSLPEGAIARLGKGRISGSIAYSPDGTQLAVPSTIGIWLYDAHTGTEISLLTGHTGQVFSVAFSPDGKTLASTGTDNSVRLWDVTTGQLKAVLEGFTESVVFSPDGKTLATSGGQSDARLWDAATGQLKAVLEGSAGNMVFSPDGTTLAGVSQGTVRLWDAATGQPKITLEGPMIWGSPLAFSPDGHILAAGHNGTILLWDMSPYIPPSAPAAIELSPPLPTQTALLANFPNPFNPDTYIPYQLHAPAHVRLSIYDVRGALVREIDLGYRAEGQYLTSASAAHWDGRDHRGERVASGVYLYRLQAGPVAHMRKMVLVK